MFIQTDLETILSYLNKLTVETKPIWGKMSAQHMVEHLSDVLRMAMEQPKMELLIPEDRIEKMQAFLESDKPMAQNIEVPFASANNPLRNEELELAIDEFIDVFLEFEEYFESDTNRKTLHSYYGMLNHQQWNRLNSKHFTHHFTQFGLI